MNTTKIDNVVYIGIDQNMLDNGFCPCSTDNYHCEHWWDGDNCCFCGDFELNKKERIELGCE